MDWFESHEVLVGVISTIVVTIVLPFLYYVYGRVRAGIIDETRAMLDAHIEEETERKRLIDVGFAELRASHAAMSGDLDAVKQTLTKMDDKTDAHGEKLAAIGATLVLIERGLNGFMKAKQP